MLFLFFLEVDFDISTGDSKKYQTLFSGKNKKNINILFLSKECWRLNSFK